ncbi:hypothetical protein L596_004532 [Steinernema carpocapsae]|uniref:Uncharacterized protein n=1 Tax=Steinernema carpocapsae TaxID=34508 RepID=A0A4U8UW94_STECR|nr:hypothetical protein L596_004532 [Steinernema carpocapsae]
MEAVDGLDTEQRRNSFIWPSAFAGKIRKCSENNADQRKPFYLFGHHTFESTRFSKFHVFSWFTRVSPRFFQDTINGLIVGSFTGTLSRSCFAGAAKGLWIKAMSAPNQSRA